MKMTRSITALAALAFLLTMGPGALSQDASSQVTWNFSGAVAQGGTWQMRVTASGREFNAGDGLTLAVEFNINSPGLTQNVNRVAGVCTLVTGARVFNQDGDMIGAPDAMASTVLTGIGLPIEGAYEGLPTDRFGGTFHHPIDSLLLTPASELTVNERAGTITGTAVHGILLDPGIPEGWYQLRIDLGLQIGEGDIVTLWGVNPNVPTTTDDQMTYGVTSPIAIGTRNQPRMIWTLFSSSLPSGGVVAVEDRGYLAATHHLGYSSSTVLPMCDSKGQQIRYLLEPDFPLVWNPFMRTTGSNLDLDYHSGWMEVRIENPDGSIVDLGGAPLDGRRGIGATTLQDRFAFSFSSYGRHRIEMVGWIKDTSNQAYVGGGIYDVYIARPIQIDTNILPGTPFTKNDFFDPGFQLYPPVPADVEVTWKLDPYSGNRPNSESFTAKANQWGYYSPAILMGRDRFARVSQIQFGTPGEYTVAFLATYREPDGTLWMGEKTLAGVVLPSDAILLAGRPPAAGSFSITSDARYVPVPADTGDTVLLPENTSGSLPTVYTFPLGFFLGNQTGFRTDDAALRTLDSGAAGTFVTPRMATSSGLFPLTYPADIDRLGYIIDAAARNDGYFQGCVTEGSARAHLPYPTFPWNPGELAADASGDIYHFWSAMVYRDIPANSTKYGSYSTGIVVSDDVMVPRVHQAGTPMISDGWGTHSAVMHNLAVRPGSIVGEGDPFTPTSYFLPLPAESTVEWVITPPGGNQRTITATAGNSGYAQAMRDRFVLDRQGVWKVRTSLIQGDQTGSILGVNPGEAWEFYVISPGNTLPIRFHLPARMPLDPGSHLLALTADLLECDIASGTIHITATFNGAPIEQTARDIQDSAFTYSIDLGQVGNSFENYDPLDTRDRIVISFLAEGLSATGQRRMAAKMVYVQGGVLYTGEKEYTPIDPRSRDQKLRELAQEAETGLAHELRGRVPPAEQPAQ